MGRRRKEKPFFESVTIIDVGAEGKALARVEGMVLFTTHVVPGDVVDLQVTRKRKNYAEARVVRLVQPSPDRVPALCQHFGVCGGCKWQFLPYSRQLYYKQKQVADQLERIGRLHLPGILPIIGSEKNTFYRNKLEFSFSNRRWLTGEEAMSPQEPVEMNALGFHIPGLFDKVLDIDRCLLQPEPSNAVRNFVREYSLRHRLPFFDIRNKTGFLRNMIVRTASTGENMLIFSFFHEDEKKRTALLQAVADRFPDLTSLLYVINSKANDTIADLDVYLFKGRDYIFERMENLRFKVGPKSFYQTNPEQALTLYRVVREFAGLTGTETVYDLYTGTGTIANFMAAGAGKVVGIDYIPEAIDDARINAQLNGISHASFYAGDVKDILNSDFILKHGQPDVLVADPPRAGMHGDVIGRVLDASPGRIVYVSCNPATQARDLALIKDRYKITRVQPIDMFPHTHHVENVVQLIKIPQET